MLVLDDRIVDLDRSEVRRADRVTRLTAIEVALLRYLAARPGRTVPRDELLREVWGYAPRVRSRSVDHTVARLRKKIEAEPATPRTLVAVFGLGYRLDLPEPSEPGWFGRRREVADLRERLRAAGAGGPRWLTLVGPGGAGKTSLARRVAAGEPWVGLEDARDAGDLVRLVAVALGVELPAGSDPVEVVGRALSAQGARVLVLDELEHVAAVAAGPIERWLALAPELVVVGTSRVPLEGRGEVVVAVGPLAEDDAVALFLARVGPDRPSEEVARRLVRALDGLPLVLEIAAARCAVIDPEALAGRLDAETLSVPDRTGRHASIDGLLADSWAALGDEDRHLLAACTCFVGPFDAEGAEAVAGARALDGLQRLVKRSLLAVTGRRPVRFSLLASVRAFAERARPEACARRHAELVVARAEPIAERWRFERQDPSAMAELEALVPELLAAVRRAPPAELEARALVALHPLVEVGRPLPDLRDRIAALARLPAEALPDGVRARIAWLAGRLVYAAGGDPALAEAHLTEALAAATTPRDRAGIAAARADARQGCGRYEDALADYREAADGFRATGCPAGVAAVLRSVGLVHLEQGRTGAADDLLREALALHRSVGNGRGEAVTLDLLGACAVQRGEAAEALARWEEAIGIARALGDRRLTGIFLTHRGNALRTGGRAADAEADGLEALRLHRALGNARFEAVTLGNLAALWLERGQLREARDALDLARVLARSVGDRALAAMLVGHLSEVHRRRGDPEAAEQAAREALAEHRALGRARSAAFALLNLALALRDRGDAAGAESALRELVATAPEPVRTLAREALGSA